MGKEKLERLDSDIKLGQIGKKQNDNICAEPRMSRVRPAPGRSWSASSVWSTVRTLPGKGSMAGQVVGPSGSPKPCSMHTRKSCDAATAKVITAWERQQRVKWFPTTLCISFTRRFRQAYLGGIYERVFDIKQNQGRQFGAIRVMLRQLLLDATDTSEKDYAARSLTACGTQPARDVEPKPGQGANCKPKRQPADISTYFKPAQCLHEPADF